MNTIDFTKYSTKQELIEMMAAAFNELTILQIGDAITFDLGEKQFTLKKVGETAAHKIEVQQ
jgi:tagatose-1,6-bisphosphate aldolase non-catalytic subunit AgaZ/GatZ